MRFSLRRRTSSVRHRETTLSSEFNLDASNLVVLTICSEITPRQIRQRVEKQLELDEGTLDAKEYRDAVKAATAEAIVSPT